MEWKTDKLTSVKISSAQVSLTLDDMPLWFYFDRMKLDKPYAWAFGNHHYFHPDDVVIIREMISIYEMEQLLITP